MKSSRHRQKFQLRYKIEEKMKNLDNQKSELVSLIHQYVSDVQLYAKQKISSASNDVSMETYLDVMQCLDKCINNCFCLLATAEQVIENSDDDMDNLSISSEEQQRCQMSVGSCVTSSSLENDNDVEPVRMNSFRMTDSSDVQSCGCSQNSFTEDVNLECESKVSSIFQQSSEKTINLSNVDILYSSQNNIFTQHNTQHNTKQTIQHDTDVTEHTKQQNKDFTQKNTEQNTECVAVSLLSRGSRQQDASIVMGHVEGQIENCSGSKTVEHKEEKVITVPHGDSPQLDLKYSIKHSCQRSEKNLSDQASSSTNRSLVTNNKNNSALSSVSFLDVKHTDSLHSVNSSTVDDNGSTLDVSSSVVDVSGSTVDGNGSAVSWRQETSVVKPLRLEANVTIRVMVSEVDTPWSFYVQPVSEVLDVLKYQIQRCVSTMNTNTEEIRLGMMCLAPFLQEDPPMFYRARVINIDSVSEDDRRAEIFYVDFGNTGHVPITSVLPLPEQFSLLPAQAMFCALSGIEPANKLGVWTEDEIQAFRSCVVGQQLFLHPVSSAKTDLFPYIVMLFWNIPVLDQLDLCELSVSNILLKQGIARPVSASQQMKRLRELFGDVELSPSTTQTKPNTNVIAQTATQPWEKHARNERQTNLIKPPKSDLDVDFCRNVNNEDDGKEIQSQCKASSVHHRMRQPERKQSKHSSVQTGLSRRTENSFSTEKLFNIPDVSEMFAVSSSDNQQPASEERSEYKEICVTHPCYQSDHNDKYTSSTNTNQDDKYTTYTNINQDDKYTSSTNTNQDDKYTSYANINQNDKYTSCTNINQNNKYTSCTNINQDDKYSSCTNINQDDKYSSCTNINQDDKTMKENKLDNVMKKENKVGGRENNLCNSKNKNSVFTESVLQTDHVMVNGDSVKNRGDRYFDISVSHINSPSDFYVHCLTVETGRNLEDLTKKLNEQFEKYSEKCLTTLSTQLTPIVNGMCCAEFSEDGCYYRTQIVSIEFASDKCSNEMVAEKPKQNISNPTATENSSEKEIATDDFVQTVIEACITKVKVLYVDFGDCEWLPRNKVYPLPDEFVQIPPLAVWCSLADIVPLGGEEQGSAVSVRQWSQQVTDVFKQLTQTSKTLRLWFLTGTFHHNSCQAQTEAAEVYLTDDSTDEEICVNLELISCGLAELHVPDTDDCIADDDIDSEWNPMAEDFMSVRNSYNVDVDDAGVATVGYKANDEQRICRFFNTPLKCWRGKNCQYRHVTETSAVTMDKVAVFVLDEDQTEVLPDEGSVVAVNVCTIFSPNHFYVNMPWNKTPIDKLQKNLQGVLRKLDEEESLEDLVKSMNELYRQRSVCDSDYTLLAPGQAVAARCPHSGLWCRAKVTNNSVEEEKVQVFFADFGNTCWVAERNIRQLEPQFLHLPQQAVECFLAGVEPVKGGLWSAQARDHFHQLVDGKTLVAHVKSRSGSGCCAVALYDTDNDVDDVDIAHALIAGGHAKKSESHKVDDTAAKTDIKLQPG